MISWCIFFAQCIIDVSIIAAVDSSIIAVNILREEKKEEDDVVLLSRKSEIS